MSSFNTGLLGVCVEREVIDRRGDLFPYLKPRYRGKFI